MWTTHILHKLILNVKLVTINMNLKNPCYISRNVFTYISPILYSINYGLSSSNTIEYAQYSDSQEGKIIWLKGDKQKNWCIHSCITISTHNKYCKLFYFHDVKNLTIFSKYQSWCKMAQWSIKHWHIFEN